MLNFPTTNSCRSINVTRLITRWRLVGLSVHVGSMTGSIALTLTSFGIDLPAWHGKIVCLYVRSEIDHVSFNISRRSSTGKPLTVNAPSILGITGRSITVNIKVTAQTGIGRRLISQMILMQIITPIILIKIGSRTLIESSR